MLKGYHQKIHRFQMCGLVEIKLANDEFYNAYKEFCKVLPN